jgi:hypothetical protein
VKQKKTSSPATPAKSASRVTVRAVNAALAARDYEAILVNGGGYFLFRGPAVNAWLDRTVQVARVGDLTIDDWVRAFLDLKRKNAEIHRLGAK